MTNIYFLQFWRLEAQDPGAGRFSVWSGIASYFIDGCLFTTSSPRGLGEEGLWGLFIWVLVPFMSTLAS